jgi:regulator of replication initiation timing
MIDEKLIKDTIIELLDANVDKETIFSTLKDIGVEEGNIEKNYKEVMDSKKTKEEAPVTEDNFKEDEKTEIKKDISVTETKEPEENTKNPEPKKEEKEPNADSLFSKPKEPKIDKPRGTGDLDETKQEDDLKQTANEVSEINGFEDQSKKDLRNDNSFTKQLSELESQVGEIKAQINALTKIMKDILEENRNILNKL